MKEPTLLQEYREKLKSKKGSALLLSLLFSVTSIIIASVILNAAVTSSRRVEKTAESSQPYYLVSSLFSVFEYEASSPKSDPDGGMEFTAELSYTYNYDENKTPEENLEENLKNNLKANNPFQTPASLETALETELGDKTNLDSLKKYAAFCLSGAMLSGSEVSRNFVVTAGGVGYDGGNTCAEYQIYCTMKVNPVDYSIQITVTDIQDNINSKSLGLPEVRTLVLPTERIEFLEIKKIKVNNKEQEFPVRAVFHYQKAKYLSEQDIK